MGDPSNPEEGGEIDLNRGEANESQPDRGLWVRLPVLEQVRDLPSCDEVAI